MLSFYLIGFQKIFSFTKKAVFVIAVLVVVISLFMHLIRDEKPKALSYDPVIRNREEIFRVINDPTLNKTTDGKIKITAYRLMMCGLVGEACTNNPKDGDKYFNRSVFGAMANLLMLPYKYQPASGVVWAYNGLSNVGIVPKAQAAQGIGFASINSFAPLWKGFRDLAYLILVIVIIIIGFMVMFRMKLNPQTVISVESALPRIVIALLMITFSFAIVGFLIDLMYLVTLVGIEIIGKGTGVTNITTAQKDVLVNDLFINTEIANWSNMFLVYQRGLYGLIDLFPVIIRGLINVSLSFGVFLLAMRFSETFSRLIQQLLGDLKGTATVFTIVGLEVSIGQIIGLLGGLALGFIFGEILLGLLIALLVVVGLLFLLFRIFFILLSSLIQIILYLMFAPLILMLEAVPGRSAFPAWIKTLIGNLAVFPAVVFLLLIASAITNLYNYNQIPILTAPLPGNTLVNVPVFTPPLLNGIDAYVIGPLINAVFLLTIPDLVKALKQSLIGKDTLQIPASPGALFGAGTAVGGSVMGLMNQLYYFQMGSSALFGHKGEDGKRHGGILTILGQGARDALTGKS